MNPDMKHLRGAMRLASPVANQGLCFHRAVAFVLDITTARLAIGTLRASTPDEIAEFGAAASPVPFIHAWCEVRTAVIAPTTYERAGNKLIAFDRADYYERNGVRDVYRFDRAWVKRIAREFGLDRHLLGLEQLPAGVSFAGTILDQGKVPYRIVDEAVLPGEAQ